MTDRLPRVTASQVARVLERQAFVLARQIGSHRNSDGRRVTLPWHGRKTIHPKVLKSILTNADLTPQQFRELLRQ